MTKYKQPTRTEAVAMLARFPVGAQVQVMAEPFGLFGPGRNGFGYPGVVVGYATLSGSMVPTGRVLVKTSRVCHYTKSSTRGGVKQYQVAQGKERTIQVWPWDLVWDGMKEVV